MNEMIDHIPREGIGELGIMSGKIQGEDNVLRSSAGTETRIDLSTVRP